MSRTRAVVAGAVLAWMFAAVASCAAAGAIHNPGTGGGTGTAATGSGGSSVGGSFGNTSSSGGAAGTGAGTATGTGTGGNGSASHCMGSSTDLEGCPCANSGATQACYPASANPKTRNTGTCKDGQQTCNGTGEFAAWGPCTGAVGPVAEQCTDGQDNDCNGLADCMDPSCASDPTCNGACTDGATRACYDGPPGTVGVGICKAGTQTCQNGAWAATCTGEVLPQTEVCSDFFDHNCNGLPGCFDFFVCFTDPACMPMCNAPPGCMCPMGVGDDAVCPDGDYGDPFSGACCPCTASTCDQIGCCGEAVCAGSGVCSGLTCTSLPASCNGMVNQDCDWEDLDTATPDNPPEDCDMQCCKCRPDSLCP